MQRPGRLDVLPRGEQRLAEHKQNRAILRIVDQRMSPIVDCLLIFTGAKSDLTLAGIVERINQLIACRFVVRRGLLVGIAGVRIHGLIRQIGIDLSRIRSAHYRQVCIRRKQAPAKRDG